MSSSSLKAGQSARLGQGASNQNLRLEKLARTSTPDSDALASSDDEGDHRLDGSQAASQNQKPTRRPSWLNDTSQTLPRPRKGSFASNSLSSPTTSHPSTPSAENVSGGPWGSHSTSSAMSRPGATSFTWGTGIWNTDRKDPPSRLTEVLPSPTSTVPPGSAGNSFFGPDAVANQLSPSSREPGPNSQIPFAIPLHPTPKTYRSQSYSVGQLEPETPTSSSGMSSSAILGRARHSGLQHRPSRPSMLSEMSNDGSILGKVKEVEDDDDEESMSGSLQGSFHQSAESKTIELLARENAMLRQQQQQYNARLRPRASTGAAYMANGYPAVPEESDYAVDELDENNDPAEYLARRASQRRMSEYGANAYRTPMGMDGRKPENANLKKALWSSSPGIFGGDASQSRRHSFANMPTRQGSITSIADSVATLEGMAEQQALNAQFQDGPGMNAAATAAYFNPGGNLINHAPNPAPGAPFNPNFPGRQPSPSNRTGYGVNQPRQNQLLHIVLFKCARADVYYIQEGTGLTVKPGDLVIVEADRGTDLGTVAKGNVDWQTARELKEHYAEEQYKWLMMYSQGAAAAHESSESGLLASSQGLPGSAVGGMGPPSQHQMQEPNAGELRPKLIKRLAQNHEIHALRDKEGQEAKAKRVCMQKVKEHGLNMEILDAEFQMDWKKLTFYYFADAYINFNSLVTDLFKIYKTRIWMSAINPASFASPTLGIQAPSGIGPGAVNAGRGGGGGGGGGGGPNDRRGNPQLQEQQGPPFAGGPPGPPTGGPGFRPGFNQSSPIAGPGPGFPPAEYGFGHPGPYGNAPPPGPYGGAMSPGGQGFPGPGFQPPADFHNMRQRFTPNQGDPTHMRGQRMSPISPQAEWQAAFQGLSLNTH